MENDSTKNTVAKIEVGTTKAQDTLAHLKDLTHTTGLLHELQALQLKMWPLVFIGGKSSVCEFNFEHKLVTFDIVKVPKRLAKLNERLEYLVKATHMLLGEEYTVVINFDGVHKHTTDGLPMKQRKYNLQKLIEESKNVTR